MNPMNILFGQIAKTVMNHSSPNTPGPSYDAGGLLGSLAGMFGQHAQQNGQQFDPGEYGSYNGYDYNGDGIPDSQQASGGGMGGNFGNVLSSDQDPLGDPGAGGGQFGNVLSSDQDPYGDPGRQ